MQKIVITDTSVLKIHKQQIQLLAGVADHYYLSESPGLDNSLGWGANGLEVKGTIRVTEQEMMRAEEFLNVHRYNIHAHNCEHFANYVLYGVNLSSQQNLWWKHLGSAVVSLLQPSQSIRDNKNEVK